MNHEQSIGLTALRVQFPAVCREINLKGTTWVVKLNGLPVVRLVPVGQEVGQELYRLSTADARDALTELWEAVSVKEGHAVITFHGRPRAVMVPYKEAPIAA